MQAFPSDLTPGVGKLVTIANVIARTKETMRSQVYRIVLAGDENDYLDLDKFYKGDLLAARLTPAVRKELLEDIVSELTALGWKTAMGYGGSALFVYSTSNPPPACWDGEF